MIDLSISAGVCCSIFGSRSSVPELSPPPVSSQIAWSQDMDMLIDDGGDYLFSLPFENVLYTRRGGKNVLPSKGTLYTDSIMFVDCEGTLLDCDCDCDCPLTIKTTREHRSVRHRFSFPHSIPRNLPCFSVQLPNPSDRPVTSRHVTSPYPIRDLRLHDRLFQRPQHILA